MLKEKDSSKSTHCISVKMVILSKANYLKTSVYQRHTEIPTGVPKKGEL